MKILIIILSLFLSSCSTLEIAHDPLNCINQRIALLHESMTFEERMTIPDPAFAKIEKYITKYKKRIESQCELIKRHNNNHKKD